MFRNEGPAGPLSVRDRARALESLRGQIDARAPARRWPEVFASGEPDAPPLSGDALKAPPLHKRWEEEYPESRRIGNHDTIKKSIEKFLYPKNYDYAKGIYKADRKDNKGKDDFYTARGYAYGETHKLIDNFLKSEKGRELLKNNGYSMTPEDADDIAKKISEGYINPEESDALALPESYGPSSPWADRTGKKMTPQEIGLHDAGIFTTDLAPAGEPIPLVPSHYSGPSSSSASSSSSSPSSYSVPSSFSAPVSSSSSSSGSYASGSDPRIFGTPIHPAHGVEDKYADEERMLAAQSVPAIAPAEAPRENLLNRFSQSERSAAAPPIPNIPERPSEVSRFEQRPLPPVYREEDPFYTYGPEVGERGYEDYQDRRESTYNPIRFASGGEVNAHGRFKMSPAEQAYIMQAQEQKNMTGDPGGPLQRGSIAAAQTVRAMPLSDKQHRKAIGKGLINFSQNFLNAPQGKYDAFTHFAQSFAPAAGAYGAGMEQEEYANEALMKQQFAKEAREKEIAEQAALARQKMGMQMLFHKDSMRHHDEMLGETKRYHDLMSEKGGSRGNKEEWPTREELEERGVKLPKGASSFADIPNKHMREKLFDAQFKESLNYAPMEKALYNLNQMDKIADEHPNLATSFALLAKNSDNPSMMDNIIADLRKEDRAAAQLYAKYSADLALNEINSLGTSRVTDMMKKTVVSSITSPSTSYEAIKKIHPVLRKEYTRKKKSAQNAEEGIANGYRTRIARHDDEEEVYEKDDRKVKAQSYLDTHPELEGASLEQIERVMNKLGL